MTTITATTLRQNLFEYLDRVAAGETIVIRRNDKEVARLISTTPKKRNWRDGLKEKVTILVDEDELIAPMEDVWEGYL